MRVIAYASVSTTDQADNGISLDAQQGKMRAYASLYGLEVVEMIVDAGESGKSLNRPGLQRALSLLKSGKADGLVVAKLDRLSRSVSDWQRLIRDFFSEKAGKQLLSVADCIDTRTAAGRLVLTILAAISEWEREAIGERTRDALQHKIRNGQRVGKVRFGYDLCRRWRDPRGKPGRAANRRPDAQPSRRRPHSPRNRRRIDRTQHSDQGRQPPMAASNRRVHPSPRSIMDELRQAILHSGETEYRVAKESGVAQPIVNRFLRGERGISLETAAKLCKYLRLHLAPIR